MLPARRRGKVREEETLGEERGRGDKEGEGGRREKGERREGRRLELMLLHETAGADAGRSCCSFLQSLLLVFCRLLLDGEEKEEAMGEGEREAERGRKKKRRRNERGRERRERGSCRWCFCPTASLARKMEERERGVEAGEEGKGR